MRVLPHADAKVPAEGTLWTPSPKCQRNRTITVILPFFWSGLQLQQACQPCLCCFPSSPFRQPDSTYTAPLYSLLQCSCPVPPKSPLSSRPPCAARPARAFSRSLESSLPFASFPGLWSTSRRHSLRKQASLPDPARHAPTKDTRPIISSDQVFLSSTLCALFLLQTWNIM